MQQILFREAFIRRLSRYRVTVPRGSEATGVSKGILKKLKQRGVAPTKVEPTKAETAVKIARCFGKTVEQFLDNADSPKAEALPGKIGRSSDTGKERLDGLPARRRRSG
ncbi:hypothetical protein [Rhodovulum visakhapatnamense]|uniref:Uncharacterized protein n=1 Tax=Rhodovulum visakhapatnamense TaxID=364297 RepID=A0ABS1RC44_9RHOB|nr:hypothetical protein [Rhodovulum visakhapatnamense]MBL3570380.1 hypothetical protein [Rhodovulum visakhapatnamense]MBL3576840.1 hypothetical protein [Rhodovulum visakhapatnamense]